ncbi:MAG TPA: MFS transporter, partial [Devosiaceae bacterium]|nr:MFS transporter [Devosiaceae bacterium]
AIRGTEEGFSLLALGLIGTSWSLGYVAGTLLVPRLVGRVGHIRSFAVMASVASIIILVNFLLVEQVSWIVLRAFSGFCFAGAAMVVESWLNEVTDNRHRGMVFAVYVMANLTFVTAGQLSLSITGVMGAVPFVMGAVAFSLAVLPTAMSLSPQPRPLLRSRLDLGLLYRTSPIAVFAAFTVGLTGGAFGTLAPVYGVLSGLSSDTIVFLMSLSIVAGALAQLPFGRASDRMDRRIVLIATTLIAALAGAGMVLVNPGEGWPVFVLFALYGLSANSIYPVAVAHANDHVKDGNFAAVAAGLLLLFGIGLMVGPVIAAAAMSTLGPVYLFMVTASVHAALAGTAYLRMRLRARPVRDQEAAAFRLVPVGRDTTPQTIALDPRSDEDGAGPP